MVTWIGIERQGQVVRLRDTKGTGRQGQSERNGDRDGDRDGGTARDVETGAPFTLAQTKRMYSLRL